MIPFVKFAPVLQATENRFRPTFVLYAYYDETGTHRTSKVVSIFGLIGNEAAWTDAQDKWVVRKDRNGIKVFHTYDCNVGDGEFCGMPRPQRDLLKSDLAEIVGRSDLHELGVTVARKDWESVTYEPFKRRYQTPYHLCLENAVILAMEWSKEHANEEPVSVVFAQQDEYAEFSEALIDFLMKTKMSKIVSSIAISTPEKMVALQVADLAANLTGRRLLNRNKALTPLDKKFVGDGSRISKDMLKILGPPFMSAVVKSLQTGAVDERVRSHKLLAFYARKADEQLRKERKIWGLLPSIKAAINKFRKRS